MKKILLICAFVCASVATAFAQEQNVYEGCTAEQIAQLFIAIKPELQAKKAEFINALQQEMKGSQGKSNAKRASSNEVDWQKLLEVISDYSGFDKERAQDYFTMVLPGYIRLMNDRSTPDDVADGKYNHEEVFRAPADGAWFGYGDERNLYRRAGLSEAEQAEVVEEGGKVKHSGSYAWGMKTVDNKVYWGDNNNYLCTFGSAMATVYFGKGENENGIVETPCMVCEYKGTSSTYADWNMGDVYPPHIYVYDPTGNDDEGVIEDIAPHSDSEDAAEQEAWKNLDNAQGLRSCGSLNGVIFFGGPGMATRDADGNITSVSDATITVSSAFLAYDADNGKWLGGSDMSNIEMPDGSESGCKVTDVRRWVIYNNQLYTGVGITDKNGYKKGGVLRWIGDKEHPFRFVCVGLTDGECGEICFHNGRIYGGGWPVRPKNSDGTISTTGKLVNSAIYRGPECPEDGTSMLEAIDPNDNSLIWENVWDYSQYEHSTNKSQFTMTYTSNMISWNGKMYWCMFSPTYSVPMMAMSVFDSLSVDYSRFERPEELAYCVNNIRGTTLWRIESDDDFDNGGVQMMYGESTLPRVKEGYTEKDGQYEIVDNVSGYKPVWGRDGYGNVTTSYTWSFMPYRDKLMISTMDWSCMLKNFEDVDDSDNKFASFGQMLKLLLNVDDEKMGWECLILENNDTAPTYLTEDGFGNHFAYGLRNFSVCKDSEGIEQLIIGTSSPMNISDGGGWQIWRVIENGQVTPTAIGNASSSMEQKVNILMRRNDGYITFSTLDGKDIDDITVTDLSGKTVYTKAPHKNIGYVFTDSLPAGSYIVRLTANGDKFSAKFVK